MLRILANFKVPVMLQKRVFQKLAANQHSNLDLASDLTACGILVQWDNTRLTINEASPIVVVGSIPENLEKTDPLAR